MTAPTSPEPTAPGLGAVQRYLEFWNTANAAEQRTLAARTFVAGVGYHAPIGLLAGTEALIAFRDQFADHQPDYVFKARAEPAAHHDRARLEWELVVSGQTFATGTDVLEVDAEGRITSITGFLDDAPAGFDPAHH